VTIIGELGAFDGRDLSSLEALRARWSPTPAVLGQLVEAVAADTAEVAVGATWLLRAWLADGAPLAPDLVRRLAVRLADVPDGFARLHLCQAQRHLSVPTEAAPAFAAFLRACCASGNTFVRAWAPDAFIHLASDHPRFGDEAKAHLEGALGDPRASVRARARKTLRGE
jgi:hypothetical protein